MYDYEKFHKNYSADIHDDPQRHIKIAELCHGLVFDIGCGTGTLTDYFTGPYIGFDIAKSAIDKAKDIRRKTAEFIVCDAMDLTNKDFSEADTIVLSEFLEHITDDKSIFDAILKTARRGTRLVISVPNGPRIRCDEHVREFTIPELRKKLAPFGRVKFYNSGVEMKQIICTCDLGEPQRADLSLAMIVKNEEKGLEKAILSAIEYVDEIIIAVDSASTDNTTKIALMYADHIKFFDWENDFAKARNFAHIDAKCKWILFIDGHETIKKCESLDEMLKLNVDGLMCTIEMENGFEFRNPRIFKKGINFVGAVHEKQQCKTTAFFPNFVIKHDRIGNQTDEASAERKKQRDEMVPRIMGEQYRHNKKNTRATFHLGMHYIGRGDLKTALLWFRRYLKYSECSGERWFVFFHMSLCYLTLNKPFLSFWYANKADNETPGRWEINKLKGLIFFEKGKYTRAIDYFINTFYQNKGNVDYKPWTRDDAGTWNAVGECFFRLNNYEKAYLAFSEASKQCNDKMIKKFFQDRANLMKDLTKSQQCDTV